MSKKIPHHRRAIVFQGGGALGAYEVGYYEALYERFVEKKEFDNPFDVVVGTSIGAINGALLVGYFQKNKTWEGSVEHLKDFWNYVSSPANFSDVFTEMWDSWRKFFPEAPSKEFARRLFSVNEFLYRGVPNVFSSPKIRPDQQFYGLAPPWFQANNLALKQSLKKFIDFPIATEYEKDEPRLLLVAVDVQEALPVVFDSYKNVNGKRNTIYGQKKEKNGEASGGFLIEYDGIEVDHVLASSNVPITYDYTKINAKEINGSDTNNGKEVTRYFWDGGLLHNTPLLPLIVYFKRFWDDYISIEKQREAIISSDEDFAQMPELYAYIVDMWPKKSKHVPNNFNEILSRYNEIMFADKTEFEEHLMEAENEKIVLFKDLIKLAKNKGATKTELEEILLKPIKTQFRAGVKRAGIDLIRGRFPLKIIRIQRRDDPDDVAHQMIDFSPKTIETLFKEGYEDSKKSLKHVFHDEREKLKREGKL